MKSILLSQEFAGLLAVPRSEPNLGWEASMQAPLAGGAGPSSAPGSVGWCRPSWAVALTQGRARAARHGERGGEPSVAANRGLGGADAGLGCPRRRDVGPLRTRPVTVTHSAWLVPLYQM